MGNLKGIIVAAVTPLDERGQFDPASFDRLLNHLMAAGIDGLFVLGMAGECPALDAKTRRLVLEQASERVKGRVPLIAGVFGDSTRIVLNHIEHYAAGRADYALTTPTNFLPLSQADCQKFFLEVAERSPLPMLMYNCPLSRTQLEAPTIARLADHPNIAGLKDTSTMINLTRIQRKVGGRKDFVLLSGHEFLFLPALTLGVDAFVMGGPGNLLPEGCRSVREAFRRGETAPATAGFLRMFDFLDEIYSLPCGALPAIKGVLHLQGITQRYLCPPSPSVGEQELLRIRDAMDRSGLFPAV